jgi:hypothetical protein
MATQVTKRQHFVPRTYLKHFSEKKGSGHYNIMMLPVNDLRPEAIVERNIESVCYQKHLYTQPGTTAEEKMILEKFYAEQLENQYEDVYSILIDPTKNQLSNEERELVIATVSTMYYRVPKLIKRHTGLMRRVFEMAIQASKQTGQEETTIENDKYTIEGRSVDELVAEYVANNKSHQVITQLKVAVGLIATRIENDNVYISQLDDGDSEFITSDNPVVIQNPSGGDFFPMSPSNILKLPLDRKHCLMLMPNKDKYSLNRIVRNNVKGGFSRWEELITNSEQLEGADECIVGSFSSLKRFLDIKDKEIPLTENEKNLSKFLNEMAKNNGWI